MSGHPGASSHRQPHRSHNDALPPLSTAPRAPLQPDSPLSTTVPSYPAQKKKYACHICDRGFTTSGHLARHARVHTGERNHKCPFPGCETRCSRQDNLQQQ
ncbi:hypothetical protein BDY19DRAFT_890184 [Irpex rosettiformis]|uniref:Uncharacterized protein n=1 Tax=Irpex rosettiformis TaxID=378272 RepID=A0ACB8U4Y4_9APHY|nr:hypothetical protein BDY19DRAFT_890184 [Irpex rosettiformis]